MNIESISAAISAGVAVVAVIISIVTLRQNNKMLYEASKPIVEIYIHGIDVHHAHKYIVVKNFGKSSAKITSISFSKPLDRFNNGRKLSSLVGTTIAPEQSFYTVYDTHYTEKVTATISYTSDIMKREEFHSFYLDFAQLDSLAYTQVTTSSMSPESKAIINSVEALIKAIK
ncbi:hypothetical protein MKK30_08140 [Lactococcus formosensis]|uniref:hypothetical protein n=1 Tax=Lactococcus formosensis TaxID=1281486 RepID=UPI001F06E537|nr:hypothetical protein [Lactococcus formosensis]MCH1723607.1 hypothetical protein [Lactococcus formosensis]